MHPFPRANRQVWLVFIGRRHGAEKGGQSFPIASRKVRADPSSIAHSARYRLALTG